MRDDVHFLDVVTQSSFIHLRIIGIEVLVSPSVSSRTIE